MSPGLYATEKVVTEMDMGTAIPEGSELDAPVLSGVESLLVYLVGEEQTAELFRLLGVRIVPVVLDANVIIRDVLRYLRTGRPTGILLAARIGFIRFFCSTDVHAEVLEHLGGVASRHGTSDEAMEAWRRQYAPLFTFLDPSGIDVLSTRALRVGQIDPEDVPTAKVTDLVRAHTVLSEDHSLSSYGSAGRNWTQLAVAYRDQSIGQAAFVSVRFGETVTFSLAVSSLEAVIARLRKIDVRILIGIGAGVAAAVLIAIAHPISRKWIKEQFEAVGAWAGDHLAGPLSEIVDALSQLNQQGQIASQFLKDNELVHESPNVAFEYVMEVMAQTYAALTAREISRRMQDLGYEPKGEHPERYVAKLLRENWHLFERHSSWRWGFASDPPEAY